MYISLSSGCQRSVRHGNTWAIHIVVVMCLDRWSLFSLKQNPTKSGAISTPSGVSAAVLEEMLLLAWYTICLSGIVPMVQIRWIYTPTSRSSSRYYTASSEMNSCAHRLCIIEVVTPVLFVVWGQNLEGHPQPQSSDTPPSWR